MKIPDNLCLTLHCLFDEEGEKPLVNKELFISIQYLKKFLTSLQEKEYKFCLPENVKIGQKNCIITFDDGYYNNALFQKIAHEFNLPFIIFLVGYNILNGQPFIWDRVAYDQSNLQYWNMDYQKIYENIEQSSFLSENVVHRPFTLEEINKLGEDKNVYFGYHGFYHQPFTFKSTKYFEREFQKSKEFMDLIHKKLNHFAFPNGLYTKKAKKIALNNYDYLFTINPGNFRSNDRVINRYSLINPDYYTDFIDQIHRANYLHKKIIRKLTTSYLSYF
ncbi:MAG: polysaccharide deacetylase family protein [Leptospiraceae bacterium]|nr:polysaccharide deacetylase family protein [Leptospiraceae bacterium]